jgi:hypothetical protein
MASMRNITDKSFLRLQKNNEYYYSISINKSHIAFVKFKYDLGLTLGTQLYILILW